MAPRAVTNEDQFVAAVQAMPVEYLECRSSQHKMSITDPFRVVDSEHEHGARPHMGNKVYARRDLSCDRCGMERHDFYAISSRRGHMMLTRINASYNPPEGYATQGLGRIPASRGLVMGIALQQEIQETEVRGQGRPRKGGAA